MSDAAWILLLDCVALVAAVCSTRRTLRTGMIRDKWGRTYPRDANPKRYWLNVYSGYVVIVICVIVLLWIVLTPGWWTSR
jgi:hypothetical protein